MIEPKHRVKVRKIISEVKAPKPTLAPSALLTTLLAAITAFIGPGGAAKLKPSTTPFANESNKTTHLHERLSLQVYASSIFFTFV